MITRLRYVLAVAILATVSLVPLASSGGTRSAILLSEPMASHALIHG